MRHAKAAHPDVSDKIRPLSTRGRRDAAEAGRWLAGEGVELDVALVSSAVRTAETYEHLATFLPSAPEPAYTDDLYDGGLGAMLDAIQTLPDDVSAVIVVGHNPTTGMLAASLDDGTGKAGARDRLHSGFPTAALALFDVNCDWGEVEPDGLRLAAIVVPRG